MKTRTVEEIRAYIDEKGIRMINLLALDLVGRIHTVSVPAANFGESLVRNGVGFDGSSYAFRKVENSDMIFVPDIQTLIEDPFSEIPSLIFFTRILLADEKRSRFSQDPRRVVEKAGEYLESTGVGDRSMWGPEYEFYIFPEARFKTSDYESYYRLDIDEDFHYNAYHASKPFDRYSEFRNGVTEILRNLGISIKYHHHETGGRGQQEIETRFGPLLSKADEFTLMKYVLFNQARRKNISVTFMPKPMYMQPGSGLHLHQFLMREGKNIFFEKGRYGNFSRMGLYYIGGLLAHAPALSALTNPSTNSYKRLVQGFEAPVSITFGLANRTSTVRIPTYASDPGETRLEYRPPDATCNPYLCFSALLLAGLDGILNEIDPVERGWGPADGRDCDKETEYALLPRDLNEALEALERDHDFLLRGGVFSEELVEQWIALKWGEVKSMASIPNPNEYSLYFDL